jgi:lipoprotein Spr
MRRLYSYPAYVCMLCAVLLLSSCGSSRKTVETHTPPPAERASKEKLIKETYADKLGVSPRDITNYALYEFIDDWYGVPYKYAGRSKDGIDCSDLVSVLYDKVYGTNLTGPCFDLLDMCKTVKEEDLKEGDLVFFKINSSKVSHVGIYLMNNKFVHASVHSGVVISDLTDTYYKKYFYKAGRLKVSLTQNTYKG